MALSLAKTTPLKPEIKLAQALSEFEAVLPEDQKIKLRTYRRQSPPNSTDVIRFTAEIDRDAGRNRKSRKCLGPRLTNVLHAVQQFSTVVDLMVGNSQSQIACAIWGTIKVSLQLASAISSYFDQLSTLFMRIGLTSPRYQDFGLLYPESARLQSTLCEYFVVIVRLCTQAVVFLKKPFWSQLSSSILKPFESAFGGFQQDLENLASTIREEVFLASNQTQQNEAKEMSRFRAFVRNLSGTPTQDLGEARTRKRKEAEFRFLDACSVYDHEKSWKQARKRGNTNWICQDEGYKQWKREKVSSTLWCTGILGSGKTVLSANVVEDLMITSAAAVAYFFCRHDEAESLETRNIIGSIARQIFDHVRSDIIDTIPEIKPGAIDIDQMLNYLLELLPLSNLHKYFIVIDGLDECEEMERRLLLRCLMPLLMSKHVFRVYCSSRPDVFRWAHTILEPQWNISMSQTSTPIEEHIRDTLVEHLDSGILSLGDPAIIFPIQDALLKNAHGMFLWVVFQIDSICSQKTDETILAALDDLPKDLPDTFNRVLRKLQHSKAADRQLCRKIFDLVAAAQRPLTLEELREAVSINPGEKSWDASKLVNDMLRTLSESCGSLVAVDEEHLTVHWAHHSVKQHLLSEPTDSDTKSYHINIKEADLFLGDVIVTYLNLGVFDRQLTKATMRPKLKFYPSAILDGSLPRSNIANRLAVRLLKSRETSRFDIHSQLATVAGVIEETKEQPQPAHPFLPYAQAYWLFHTREFNAARVAGYSLWEHLIDEEVKTIELPWAPKRWRDFGNEYMNWIIQNDHWALIDRSLAKSTEAPIQYENTKHLLKFLERRAADMNAQNINLNAALYLASELNNQAVVLLSLEKGADINATSGYYGTALQTAAAADDKEIAGLLLKNGANINAEGGRFGTALQAASYHGHKEMVRFLLANGADTSATSGEYGTALQVASFFGRREVVRLLLENGADIDAASDKHCTALQAASSHGLEEKARFLVENGADINAVSGKYGTALHAASCHGEIEIARLLLGNGANVNAMSGKYGTALLAASCHGENEIVRLLLENGANANAAREFYGTALQAASYYGQKETARLLLANGADADAVSGQYGTALQAASGKDHEVIVRLLLENGADVNAASGFYGTALQAASFFDRKEVARLLLENGADVNAASGFYGTALQAASGKDHEVIVRLLLENGANVNAEGGRYGTALQAALICGHEKMARFLLKNGAITNKTMEEAPKSGSGEVINWYAAALESEPSLVRGPTPFPGEEPS